MKQTLLILIFSVLTSIISCEPPVTFNEPQPIDKNSLLEFPKRLMGEYISLVDSSTIRIQNNIIERIYDTNYMISKNEVDSNYKTLGDTLIDLKTNEKTHFIEIGDSLLLHVYHIDTVFQINKDNVLKKFKGYYFLNTLYSDREWSVSKIQPGKNQITISSISTANEIKNLQEITDSPLDTIPPYNFKATKKQFKEFVKNGGFSEREIFVRQVSPVSNP